MAGSDMLLNAVSWAMGPSILAIIVATVVALSFPIFLHIYIHHVRPGSVTTLPTFLFLGPSGSGKTTLLTQLERGNPASTHTSQSPLGVEISLPVSTITASSRYRSQNDPTLQAHKKFLLVDTPGHGKLRHHAWDQITSLQNLKGIIFLLDAANLTSTDRESTEACLQTTAEYLHDLLLLLQKRTASSKSSKAPSELPVLIAANKSDLFTALPVPLVRSMLENEIGKIRDSKARGLFDSAIDVQDDPMSLATDPNRLGDGGEGKFDFDQMRESNVVVQISRGNVLGPDGSDLDAWWAWIANRL